MSKKILLIALFLLFSTVLTISCNSSNDTEAEKLRKELEELKKEKTDQEIVELKEKLKEKEEEAEKPKAEEPKTETKSKSKPKPDSKGKPKFSDYPVNDVYSGKNQPLVLDEFGKNFKSRLTDAIKNQKPTFAGQYLVAGWGCGTGGCNTGAVIDAKTGRAYPFPVSISSVSQYDSDGIVTDDFQEHEYQLNSRLMMFAGNLEGSEHTDGNDIIEYYEFRDGKFIFIKSMPYGKSK